MDRPVSSNVRRVFSAGRTGMEKVWDPMVSYPRSLKKDLI